MHSTIYLNFISKKDLYINSHVYRSCCFFAWY